MKIAYVAIIAIHGLIHLLGFLKAYEISNIQELSLPISKSFGLLWLAAVVLFLAYVTLFMMDARFHWLAGLAAVVLSQFLVIYFWPDAKFGTIPNILILVVVLCSYGDFRFDNMVSEERSAMLSEVKQVEPSLFTEDELSGLPAPVQQWLKASGAVGKEHVYAGKVEQDIRMKLEPGQRGWYRARALQYTTVTPPSLIWTVDVHMNQLIQFRGRDKFVDGKGAMLIKVNSLINAVNAQGEKLDEGTLQRFLGEMVWFPSLALSTHITWEDINEHTAKATMSYRGTTGSGTFYFNDEGEFVKFSAMRFKDHKPGSKRYSWLLTVEDYEVFEGIKVPSKMKATWKLPEGDWTWLNLEISDLKYNQRALR